MATIKVTVKKKMVDGDQYNNCIYDYSNWSAQSRSVIDATHGSLALKAYQQNLYLEYYY